MEPFIGLFAFLGAIYVFLKLIQFVSRLFKPADQASDISEKQKPTVLYRYKKKNYLMTNAESAFFHRLQVAVGNEYYVFPQMRLSALFDYRVHGQSWKPALAYINQKSVDFVICDKQDRRTLAAIELDDWSHDSEERRQRDMNVEHIFQNAGLPLIRFRNTTDMATIEIRKKIHEAINTNESSGREAGTVQQGV